MAIDLFKYISDYGIYHLKIKSFAEQYAPSKDVLFDFDISGATIEINGNRMLNIIRNLPGHFQFEIIVDDTFPIGTFEYNSEEDFQPIDLEQYDWRSLGIQDKWKINIRAIQRLDGETESVSDNYSNDVYYYSNNGALIYGVSGLADSSMDLTRTDDAENLSYSINRDTGEISSDFNNTFPWNETEIVENENGKFLKFPNMWFRVHANESGNITDIAVSAAPVFGESEDWFFVKEFLYGCYGASLEKKQFSRLVSKPGCTRVSSYDNIPSWTGATAYAYRSSFRTWAENAGEGYHQLDLYHFTIVRFLFLIEFATKNSAKIMIGRRSGTGRLGGQSLRPTGGTDLLTTPSGYELDYLQMRYHYIEDFYGNLYEFIDGICCQSYGSSDYIEQNYKNFSDVTTNMQQLSYKNPPSSYSYPVIMTLGWDSNHPFMCMPTQTINTSSYNQYFCNSSTNYGNSILYIGACYTTSYDASAQGDNNTNRHYGLYFMNRTGSTSNQQYVGGRLIKEL